MPASTDPERQNEPSVGRDPPSLPRRRRQSLSEPLASHQGLVVCLALLLLSESCRGDAWQGWRRSSSSRSSRKRPFPRTSWGRRSLGMTTPDRLSHNPSQHHCLESCLAQPVVLQLLDDRGRVPNDVVAHGTSTPTRVLGTPPLPQITALLGPISVRFPLGTEVGWSKIVGEYSRLLAGLPSSSCCLSQLHPTVALPFFSPRHLPRACLQRSGILRE